METKSKRFSNLRKVLERSGPFCHPEFVPGADNINLLSKCKVLVVGAGGLGCELLKNLAMMGFQDIHVIDMDSIDLSNLNRQFLFRRNDVGKSKAEVAAKFINSRVPGCRVVPYYSKIQDFNEDFYKQFNLVICGLDSVVARRWINGMLVSMLSYDRDDVDPSTIIPLIDGGTEGFKGNSRVIIPGITACIECTLDLFPPQVTFPLCTIATTPRLPEHCVEYVKILLWPKENPFDCPIDGDDPMHLNWIYEKAAERASSFNISGVTYSLTQGVVKNIIPAVASTNAAIAAVCATEAFKMATSCCLPMNNYTVFNDVDGIYTYTYEAERKDDCLVCSPAGRPKYLPLPSDRITLAELIEDHLCSDRYMMKTPSIIVRSGETNRTLYWSSVPSLELTTRPNLKKTLLELDVPNGAMILVADATNPMTLEMIVRYENTDN